MDRTSNKPTNLYSNQGKLELSQKQTIFQYLLTEVATASMVSDATGVPQKSFTRYKRDLEKSGILWEVDKKACKRTGYKAWYLTTNPNYTPVTNQLQILFNCD